MTYDELKRAVECGRVVLCRTRSQKRAVINMMLEMGFYASDIMKHSVDMDFPYIGLNLKTTGSIDAWTCQLIGKREDSAINAEEFLAFRDEVSGLQPVMSLYE